ncbi:UDP-N-acetylmuramoyl-L-alanyl-D-glutamate--2,6-diaminopimelate ligase [Niabella hibiscisoli]|uniref:UDP-N-acetylmuramoyl-L-alanyl-D-glutamate--2, 6-diaminopimelate ligase n=1 Tax=Niabella hibiscisoli TaxID=1825928 RepID=UPI001F100D40|nr:UDP-N-acetylmuramoyl-L-alanyl-D-glutamate--2,6-diaminopimelate ligase [Niabella hibiscisoli]MCH5714718.1 UDP-N-acetylmuramoyl-L-alanyl-D-glutamate--2,6-diaminopimelate ligase [Niabella hibiscisoli]
MLLQEVLYKTSMQSVAGATDIAITGISIDSRNVQAGHVFIALKGVAVDGHQFISKAIQKGAVAIVCEVLPDNIQNDVTYIQVENSAAAAGIIAHNFYGRPSASLKLVGVTGTNGKTTVATLLYQLFSGLGYKCGLLSTVQNHIGSKVVVATHTTPDAVQLNQLLGQMAEEGCSYVFMEVSSHAINQHRIEGLEFAGGIFTNISHDHLDYHKTFDEYIRVKKLFFDTLPKTAFAITNIDDKRGMVMVQNTLAATKTYSLKAVSDFKGKILDNGIMGLHMLVDDQEVHFRLIGSFNAHNLLAVYGAAICLGQDRYEVLQTLSTLNGAEGRFEYIISPNEKIIAIIDYAHTPDALLNVLATIKKLKKGFEQVITVAGCGGNRDKTKRPVMAEVACEYSDRVILTSDNPRFEDAAEIIKDMEAGVPAGSKRKCISITDRREAIKTAITLANKEDIVLVAGKGHEKYQEVSGVKHHFDDKEVVREMFELLNK